MSSGVGTATRRSASLRRVIVLRAPIRLSAVRARGSQEAGRRSRGVEFAPDSPLERHGFEPLVPRKRERFRDCRRLAFHARGLTMSAISDVIAANILVASFL
jgi:hypothetical protein